MRRTIHAVALEPVAGRPNAVRILVHSRITGDLIYGGCEPVELDLDDDTVAMQAAEHVSDVVPAIDAFRVRNALLSEAVRRAVADRRRG